MDGDVWPGRPLPLGANYDAGGGGTNFSVFSATADRIQLCLFDSKGRETRRVLPETTRHCWHVPDHLSWDMKLPIAPMAVPGKTPFV